MRENLAPKLQIEINYPLGNKEVKGNVSIFESVDDNYINEIWTFRIQSK